MFPTQSFHLIGHILCVCTPPPQNHSFPAIFFKVPRNILYHIHQSGIWWWTWCRWRHYLFNIDLMSNAKYTVNVLFKRLFPSFHLHCGSHQELHTEGDSNDPVLLRKKRMAQVEKNTCQLFIQTDHLFYKYYKTREAVIAQVIHNHHHSPINAHAAVVLLE